MRHDHAFTSYERRLKEFIRRSAASNFGEAHDTAFEGLAVELFQLQAEFVPAYRDWCRSVDVQPSSVRRWPEIPAIPIIAFKELDLTSLAVEKRTRLFLSSGTTEQRRSRHYHNAESLACYHQSLLEWFRPHLVPDRPARFYFLTPRPQDAPHSSLVEMFHALSETRETGESVFLGETDSEGNWSLDFSRLEASLSEATASHLPVALFGTAFLFVHACDHFALKGRRFSLPPGSRILETGGYKGRSRTLPKDELHAELTRTFGVPPEWIVTEYGMSELSSQAYDHVAGQASALPSERVYRFPPWVRIRVISPETSREAAENEPGLLQILDLANIRSVAALQTEDLAARRGQGFQLLGRAAAAEPRGCSLMARE